jgi:hypothetical protein
MSAVGLCALLGCAGSPGKPARDAAAGEVVTLAFAWPADLVADVDVKRVRTSDEAGTKRERVIEARYRLRTEPRPGALRVVSEDLRVISIDGRPVNASPAGVAGADTSLAALAPTLQVDAEGHVVEVEGLSELRRQLGALIAGSAPEAAPRAEQIAGLALSPEKLSEHWTTAVESWVGMELELGASYEMEFDEGQPGTLEVSERLPCSATDGERRCVRLLLESSLGGEAGTETLRSQARDVTGQIGATDVPAEVFESMEMREKETEHRYRY